MYQPCPQQEYCSFISEISCICKTPLAKKDIGTRKAWKDLTRKFWIISRHSMNESKVISLIVSKFYGSMLIMIQFKSKIPRNCARLLTSTRSTAGPFSVCKFSFIHFLGIFIFQRKKWINLTKLKSKKTQSKNFSWKWNKKFSASEMLHFKCDLLNFSSAIATHKKSLLLDEKYNILA